MIVLPHPHRREACDLGKRIVEYASSKNVEVRLYEDWPEDITGDFDVGIVIGGDGTLLRASRLLSPFGIPILGVKVGGLGFLLDVEPEYYRLAIDKLLSGNYFVEKRGTLEVIVESEDVIKGKFLAINDAVVNKGTFARMLEITLFINGNLVARYPADGIIVSTPTGSTAYSLSAGGPIVSPNLDCILVTPICPHSLFLRPLLLNPKDTIEIVVGEKHEEVMLTIDGQLGLHLDTKDRVRVNFSNIHCKLIRLSENSNFFVTLREKLHWGEGIGDAQRDLR
ncbi:MAG: NAD(+)/NADH kinase [bacterium]|nr:NAD(+)/NADH kinase [bacterium]